MVKMLNNPELARHMYEQRKGYRNRRLKRAAQKLPQRFGRQSLLELRFKMLKRRWQSEAELLSSPTEIAMLDSYQQIIGMGPQVIPLIMRELSREVDLWFWALRAITGVDPVPEECLGDLDEMAKHWLSWFSSRKERGW